ncbi:MAG TPA: DUF167 family protein [Candidatus Limnocylindrales bacterium]|nr:DUF167 family protein [Candidatus Limnocylindrales bacterium]
MAARAHPPPPAADRDIRLLRSHRPVRARRRDARLPLGVVLAVPDVRFAVRLTPRGGADRTEGVVDGVLRARVSAPAIEGAANQALLRLLAEELGVPKRDVRLVAGAASRTKLVVIEGVVPERVLERWPGLRV